MRLLYTTFFTVLTSLAIFTGCSGENIDPDKDGPKIESKDPLAGCSDDLKTLDEWVKAMVAKRNKGEEVDMKEGEALVKKLKAAKLPENCQKILDEKIKSMSTESVDKQKAIDACLAKCDEIKIPPEKIKCKNTCK